MGIRIKHGGVPTALFQGYATAGANELAKEQRAFDAQERSQTRTINANLYGQQLNRQAGIERMVLDNRMRQQREAADVEVRGKLMEAQEKARIQAVGAQNVEFDRRTGVENIADIMQEIADQPWDEQQLREMNGERAAIDNNRGNPKYTRQHIQNMESQWIDRWGANTPRGKPPEQPLSAESLAKTRPDMNVLPNGGGYEQGGVRYSAKVDANGVVNFEPIDMSKYDPATIERNRRAEVEKTQAEERQKRQLEIETENRKILNDRVSELMTSGGGIDKETGKAKGMEFGPALTQAREEQEQALADGAILDPRDFEGPVGQFTAREQDALPHPATMEEAMQLPPGTRFVDTEGMVRVVPPQKGISEQFEETLQEARREREAARQAAASRPDFRAGTPEGFEELLQGLEPGGI